MSTPDVFLYSDYHRYLDAWLNHEPAEGRREVGAFAHRASCSLPHVSNVRYGTRCLEANQIASFCFAMSFTTEDASYYTALVIATDATADEEREKARATMDRLRAAHGLKGPRPGPDRPLSCPIPALAPGEENLERWQIPVLRAMGACPGAPETLAAQVDRIRPPVELAQAAVEDRGPAISRFSLADGDPATRVLLQQGIGAARWALYQVPRVQRSYWSSYWCLPESALQELRAASMVHDDRMAALFAEVAADFRDPCNLVYQWATQIFPLSRPVPPAEPGEAPYRLFTPRKPLDIPPLAPPPVRLLPSIFDSPDYRTHLDLWFKAKRVLKPDYTAAMFARRAHCSATQVDNVVRGVRDLHHPQIQGFARAMGLTEEESAFWAARVEADQAKSLATRARLLQRLAGFTRFHNAQPLVGAALQCASSALHIATYELGFAGEFQASPEWVSEALGVPESAAAAALQDLAACKLLKQDGSGQWRPSSTTMLQVMVEAEPVEIMLEDQGLEAAQVALAGATLFRHATALFGPVPASAVPHLTAEAKGVQRELDELASALQATALGGDRLPERMFIIQTQLLPASERTDLPPLTNKERRASLRLPKRGISKD